jgi:hypothetical protein
MQKRGIERGKTPRRKPSPRKALETLRPRWSLNSRSALGPRTSRCEWASAWRCVEVLLSLAALKMLLPPCRFKADSGRERTSPEASHSWSTSLTVCICVYLCACAR